MGYPLQTQAQIRLALPHHNLEGELNMWNMAIKTDQFEKAERESAKPIKGSFAGGIKTTPKAKKPAGRYSATDRAAVKRNREWQAEKFKTAVEVDSAFDETINDKFNTESGVRSKVEGNTNEHDIDSSD